MSSEEEQQDSTGKMRIMDGDENDQWQ